MLGILSFIFLCVLFIGVLYVMIYFIKCLVPDRDGIDRQKDRQNNFKNYRSKNRSTKMCGRSTLSSVFLTDAYNNINTNSNKDTHREETVLSDSDIEIIEDPIDVEYDEILVFLGRYYIVEKDNKLKDITYTLDGKNVRTVRLLPLP